jgi:hypothetical protein
MSETNDAASESLVTLVEQIMAARETVSPELRAKQRQLLQILANAGVPLAAASVRAGSSDESTGQAGQDETTGAKT